ncbi:MAG: hypothetical protein ACK50Q_01385 [Labrys sp. (in: a-proteobacteria)]
MCTPTGNRPDDPEEPAPLQRFSLTHAALLTASGAAGLVVHHLVRSLAGASRPDNPTPVSGAAFDGLAACVAGSPMGCWSAEAVLALVFLVLLPMSYWIASREFAETRSLFAGFVWAVAATLVAGAMLTVNGPGDVAALLVGSLAVAAAFERGSDVLRLTFGRPGRGAVGRS